MCTIVYFNPVFVGPWTSPSPILLQICLPEYCLRKFHLLDKENIHRYGALKQNSHPLKCRMAVLLLSYAD